MAHTRHNRLIIHHQHYTERMQNASFGDISIIHNSPLDLALSPPSSEVKTNKWNLNFPRVRVVTGTYVWSASISIESKKKRLYEGKIEQLCPQHQFLLRLYLSSPFAAAAALAFFGSKNINFTRIQCDVIVARWIVLNILKLSVCWKSLLISFRDLIKFPYKFIALIPSRSVK